MNYQNLIERLKEYSNSRKGEIAELTREAAEAIEAITDGGPDER